MVLRTAETVETVKLVRCELVHAFLLQPTLYSEAL
jgi:hypothetical protein